MFLAFTLYLLLVFYQFIYLYLPVYINKKLQLGIFFLPFLFTVFEYLKSVLFYGLPLGNFNILVWNIPVFIKSASYFSSYFVSFELILVNIAMYFVIKKNVKSLPILAFIILVLLIPYQKPYKYFLKTISIVQGGIPQNEKWESKFLSRNLNIYINATKTLKSDVVFWPESAYPYIFDKGNNLLSEFGKNKQSLVVGVVREVKNKYYNSVVFINREHINYYNKQMLVPFAEFMPFRAVMEKLLPQNMDPGDFSRGNKDVIFQDKNLKIGPMICYEESFSFISRHYKDKGANMLAVLTNDAWFSDTPTFYMLSRNAVFRAVENSIWLVRVANNGISEIISPKGDIIAQLPPYKECVLTKKLKLTDTRRTTFDKFGYVFPLILIVFVSLSILYKKYKHRRQRT